MLWFHNDARYKGAVTAIFYWITLIAALECMQSDIERIYTQTTAR